MLKSSSTTAVLIAASIVFMTTQSGCGRLTGVIAERLGRATPETFTDPNGDSDAVIAVADDDTAINTAVSQARAKFDLFADALAAPTSSQSSFMVKASFATDRGEDFDVEHMWVEVESIDGENVTGRLINTPGHINHLKYGDAVTVTRDNLSDWSFVDGGKLVGGYTVRVLRERLIDTERAKFDAESGFVIDEADSIDADGVEN